MFSESSRSVHGSLCFSEWNPDAWVCAALSVLVGESFASPENWEAPGLGAL
jgi:hypothetical protein